MHVLLPSDRACPFKAQIAWRFSLSLQYFLLHRKLIN